ncbi:DUF4870 domain-containing protein [Ruania alba]|uniref:DUF4870 domain-containing protein n=1 Tax=Ruania alba TaxID=648782 RepID=A0A1H5NHR0_9MICO|nr:DUF4870 domain-containing protein [Ruania alba]SEF01202.1 hypothetical protein SAMN04488554_4362 [Ruania alba]
MTQQPYPQQARGDDRTIAILAHLSPIIAMIVSIGFVSIAGPLLVWLIWRDRGPLVRNAAASSFNFHLTVWVAMVVGWIMVFTVILLPLGLFLIFIPGLIQLIFSIIGAVRASRGEVYSYPFQIRILH